MTVPTNYQTVKPLIPPPISKTKTVGNGFVIGRWMGLLKNESWSAGHRGILMSRRSLVGNIRNAVHVLFIESQKTFDTCPIKCGLRH